MRTAACFTRADHVVAPLPDDIRSPKRISPDHAALVPQADRAQLLAESIWLGRHAIETG